MASSPSASMCAHSFQVTGADVVAKFGYSFSFLHGWKGALPAYPRIRSARVALLIEGRDSACTWALRLLVNTNRIHLRLGHDDVLARSAPGRAGAMGQALI